MTEKELIDELSVAYSDDDVAEWMEMPNVFYDGKTPKQLIKEKNTEELEKFLKKLKTGRFTKDRFNKNS